MTKVRNGSYVDVETRPYEQARKLQAQLGGVELTFVEKVFRPLVADEHGTSIGAKIDELLCESVANGKVVQDVAIHLDPSQIEAVTDYYRGA